jgi:hypothetical protein
MSFSLSAFTFASRSAIFFVLSTTPFSFATFLRTPS